MQQQNGDRLSFHQYTILVKKKGNCTFINLFQLTSPTLLLATSFLSYHPHPSPTLWLLQTTSHQKVLCSFTPFHSNCSSNCFLLVKKFNHFSRFTLSSMPLWNPSPSAPIPTYCSWSKCSMNHIILAPSPYVLVDLRSFSIFCSSYEVLIYLLH